MEPLDDLAYLDRVDPERMLARIQEFPAQCQAAWDSASRFAWPPAPQPLTSIVIAGMGGSAIAGDLVADLVAGACPVPVLVHRNYGLPAFVGAQTLVVASSYSGDTEETLSAAHEALRRGAPLVGLATGGQLGALAAEAGFPFFTIHYHSKPRAALAHSFAALLCFLQNLRLIPEQGPAMAEAVRSLRAMEGSVGVRVPTAANAAKRLAQRFHRRLGVIYGVGFLGSVAHRWKTQLNENTKAWAFYETLPEMNHNAIVGYEQPDELNNETFVALLDSPANLPQNQRRTNVTAELLERAGVDYEVIEAEGPSPLAQMLTAVHLGDYVSFYLAALYGIDPTRMEGILILKERLRGEAASR